MKHVGAAEPRLAGRRQWRSIGGRSVLDPFAWLEDLDPGVAAELWNAEATFARDALAPITGLTDEIERELWSRLQPDEMPPAVPHGPYLYSVARDPDDLHVKHYRTPRSGGAAELILDEGETFGAETPADVHGVIVSPDHRRLLVSRDTTNGTERLTLRVRDLTEGRWCDGAVEDVANTGLAWAPDSDTYFCVLLDAANRPWRAVRCRVSEPNYRGDVLLAERPEMRLRLRAGEAGRHVLLTASSHETSETWALEQSETAEPRLIATSEAGRRVFASEGPDGFYMLVTHDGGASEIRHLPTNAPGPNHAAVVYTAADHEPITALQAFSSHLLLFQRVEGEPRIKVLRLSDHAVCDVPVPETPICCHPGDNREFDAPEIRFGWDGPVTPYVHARYILDEARTETLRRQDSPGLYPEKFDVVRRRVMSRDAEIPVSLVLPAGRHGPVPMLLYVYGAYGVPIDDNFSILPLHLVDNGIGYAVCHVRGGGEFGPRWWKDGAGRFKINGIRDFAACADDLVVSGLADPSRLGAMAESAGAFLVAAAMNMRPGLLRVAVLDCPFLDPLAILGNPTIPFTPTEWSEWGNPACPEDFENLQVLSPYSGVRSHAYANTLVYTSAMDQRTPDWEGLKWTAKVRNTRTDPGSVIVKRREEAGHFGEAAPRVEMREWAEKLAFVRSGLSSGRDW